MISKPPQAKSRLNNERPMGRRRFLKSSLYSGISAVVLCDTFLNAEEPTAGTDASGYRLTRDVPARLFDGANFWCHPRAGIIPGKGKDGLPRVAMTMNTMNIAGMDVFKNVVGMETDDLKTWSKPDKIEALSPRYETIQGQKRPVAVCDFWPTWHRQTKTLLGTGHTVAYTTDWKVKNDRPRHTAYAAYDVGKGEWKTWRKLGMPAGAKFYNSGAGCSQRYDMADGTILLPFYFKPGGVSQVAVARCSFDGETLQYLEHGTELSIDNNTRGLHEPSLTRFGGEYFMTIRNDKLGLVARSRDGLHFEPYQPWLFNDGRELGNYNTQQHWVTHSDALYLAYTRRGADNDHVFRHRAPLFMAQVDPEKLRVIRQTERILVPQRGARLGNFGVTNISESETWVTVSEWMQPKGVQRYGSDGSVYVARIHWARPNRYF